MSHPAPLAARCFCSLLSFVMFAALTPAQRPAAAQDARTQTPAAAAPQQPSPQQPPGAEDDEVVQITTNLVQIDAVVTDRDGQQVTDLRADEFELYEDGERREITNFSYVSLAPETSPVATPAPKIADRNAPPAPPVRLRPEQVRRTIALVVDDLGLSFESTAYVRRALRKYVDEQMLPTDLVAIIRTSAGAGALQQFTSDKRQLYAAIERVRWYPLGRGGISPFAPINSLDEQARGVMRGSEGASDQISARNSEREDVGRFREDIFTVGTLGALNFVVRGLRELPGRKAVVLFSDGLRLFNRFSAENGGDIDPNNRLLEAMRRLTDAANRASVIFYTLDARGLQTLGFDAADDTSGLSPQRLQQRLSDRRAELQDTQDGLIYLAQQTGGTNVRNSNDLPGGIRRALEDLRGYYLIGYRPDERTFDRETRRPRFNKLELRLKDSRGRRIRTRSGFYGVPSEETRPAAPRTRGEQMVAALTSPFATGGVPLRLTSFFGNDAKAGSFASSMLHIDANKLTFVPEADGWQKCVMDIIAVTFGADGRVVDEINRTHTFRARGSAYETLRRDGLVYTINLPIKKAGAYQLRVAVRDAATETVGSASQFIEIPDLGKNRLTLSGVVLYETPASAPQKSAASPADARQKTAAPSEETTQAAAPEVDLQTSAAVRRFPAGALIDYGYQIYNAKRDRPTARPQLQTRARLFRDGKLIYDGAPVMFDATGETDAERLNFKGRFQLGSAMQPGDYVLQVVVTDLLAKGKQSTAQQWIDFEIVRTGDR